LKTFENSLGFRLFERKHRKLELNERGREILERAEKIFGLGDELVSALSGETPVLNQQTRIGATLSVTTSFLFDFVKLMWKTSRSTLHVTHAPMPDLLKSLEAGDLDLVLSDSPHHRPQRYRSFHLSQQRVLAVGPKSLLRLRRGFPSSLNGVPYVSFGRHSQLQDDIEFYLRSKNVRPRLIASADDVELISKIMQVEPSFSVIPEGNLGVLLETKKVFNLGAVTDVKLNYWAVTSTIGGQRQVINTAVSKYLERAFR
jgi:LysR family transcriptional activator of nhaA